MISGARVLVTGGAGFIGSELARQLEAAGAEVRVLDNLVNGKRENLEDALGSSACLEEADIRDRERVAELLRGTDIVLHLACLGVRHSIHSPRENHEVNATATLQLLEESRRAEVGRFVYVSSSEVYGTARTVPMDEDHPTYPCTVYGASKLAGECYARAYHQTYGFPTVIIRPFNSFGPRSHHEGDSGEVIPKFMLRCIAERPMVVFGDGTQTRDFTYVSDTACAIVAAATKDSCIGHTLNIGSGREVQIGELAAMVKEVTGRPEARIEQVEARPGDVRRLYADSSRAAALLGFAPTVSLREGLTKLRNWYEQSGRSADELLKDETTRNWLPEVSA